MTTRAPSKAGPGRPRTLPEGTTASDRAALAERALKASGGHRLNVPLNASAWAALQRLAPRGKRVAYIERLILAAAKQKTGVLYKVETCYGSDPPALVPVMATTSIECRVPADCGDVSLPVPATE